MATPAGTMPTKMILSGTKIAWVFLLSKSDYSSGAGLYDTLEPLWYFDNIKEAKFGIPKSPNLVTENLDIMQADKTTIRFPTSKNIIDGISERTIADNAATSAKMTITTNEAPYNNPDSDTLSSMTEFQSELIAYKDDKFLIIIPTGYSYSRTGTGNTKSPDGYAYMIGQRSNDIELTMNESPVTVTIEFQPFSIADSEFDFDSIKNEGELFVFDDYCIFLKKGS